jgi:hypothetical protein
MEKLTAKEIIRKLMAEKKMSIREASEDIGFPRRGALASVLYSKKSMNLDTFQKIMDGLGWDVLVQQRSSKRCFMVSMVKPEEIIEDESEK